MTLEKNPDADFAAILDNNGKLIAAELRSQLDLSPYGHNEANKSYLFYSNYLIPGIRDLHSNSKKFIINKFGFEIELIQMPVNGDTEIATIPLDDANRIYLCVYFRNISFQRKN